MTFDPKRPFNDLPVLPPGADVETKAVLRGCIKARAALAELRISCKLIPNTAMLINSISVLEAQASTEIENIVTTADRLFLHASDTSEKTDQATKEAQRNRVALLHGTNIVRHRPVSTALAVEVCRTITGIMLDIRKIPGTALAGEASGNVIYTPPVGEKLLRDKLANWESYIHEQNEMDPLIRLAVMHYQFEAIHPFVDGNGRTGRVLNLLYLVDKELLDSPVLNLSQYINRHKERYYKNLLEVTVRQDWETWVLFMLEAVRSSAQWTVAKIEAVRELLDVTSLQVRRNLPKIYSRELIELIFLNPYSRIENLVKANVVKRQTASVYLGALVDEGILEKIKVGRQNFYMNRALLTLLLDE